MKTDIRDYDELFNADDTLLAEIIKRDFYKPSGNSEGLKSKALFSAMRAICQELSIKLDNEQMIYLMCNMPRVACCATAGGGKTTTATFSTIRAIKGLNLDPSQVLVLAYNVNAVASFENRLNTVCGKMHSYMHIHRNRRNLVDHKILPVDANGFTPDGERVYTSAELDKLESRLCIPKDTVKVKTFHSFCKTWTKEYCSEFSAAFAAKGTLSIMTQDWEINSMMEDTLLEFIEMKRNMDNSFKIVGNTAILSEFIVRLYDYAAETLSLSNPQEWEACSALVDLKQISNEDLIVLFRMFYKKQINAGKVTFTTILLMFNKLLDRPDVVKRIRKLYKYILVDEYQDFTPLMISIVKKIFNENKEAGIPCFTDGYLSCIGDDDQSIYGFKGANSMNFVNFKKDFAVGLSEEDIKIVSMSYNRRCPKNIMDVAQRVVDVMPDRIEKPLLCLREGGNIYTHEYSDTLSEIDDIIAHLDRDNLANTVITYRNIASSNMLTLRLMEEGIPFRPSDSCVEPLSDLISRTYLGVLEMLYYWDNPKVLREHFYKVVPNNHVYNKYYYQNVFDTFIKQKDAAALGTEDTPAYIIHDKPFIEFDWSEPMRALPDFGSTLRILTLFHDKVRSNEPLSEYMPKIQALISKFFLKRLLTGQLRSRYSEEYINYISNYFCPEKSYDDFLGDVSTKRTELNKSKDYGAFITTFHGLKGLEYDNVFAMDMAESIFPGGDTSRDGLTPSQLHEKNKQDLKLMYVLITRTKENFHAWFSSNDPSSYLSFFNSYSDNTLSGDFTLIGTSRMELEYKFLMQSTSEYIYPQDIVITKPEDEEFFGDDSIFELSDDEDEDEQYVEREIAIDVQGAAINNDEKITKIISQLKETVNTPLNKLPEEPVTNTNDEIIEISDEDFSFDTDFTNLFSKEEKEPSFNSTEDIVIVGKPALSNALNIMKGKLNNDND